MLPIARDLADLGFKLIATRGTAAYLRAHGLDVDVVFKVNEGRPNIADEIVNHKVDLVVNTPLGRESFFDDRAVRRAAMMHEVPCITTLTGAAAAVSAIRATARAGRRRPRAAGLLRRNCRRQRLDDRKFCDRTFSHPSTTKTRRPRRSSDKRVSRLFVNFVASRVLGLAGLPWCASLKVPAIGLLAGSAAGLLLDRPPVWNRTPAADCLGARRNLGGTTGHPYQSSPR